MPNKNQGLILYNKIIRDNNLFIKLLSDDDKISSGMIYGGNSSKKKLIYQVGYIIEFHQSQKNINSINSINGEISKPFIVNIFNDKFKSFSLLAIISILNTCLYEGVKINGLFQSVKDLIIIINNNNHWLSDFCIWLLFLLKLLGYEIKYNYENNKRYFNLQSLNFEDKYKDKFSLIFPYNLLIKKEKINYESVNSIFILFETIIKQYHLSHYDVKMPENYLNFKKIILNELNNNE